MRGPRSADGRAVQLCELRGRVPADHPLRPIRTRIVDERCGCRGEFQQLYAPHRAALDPAGEAAAGPAAAGVLLGALGAAADGAARLQPAVPLVRRPRRSTIRSGTPRCSPRTATGCSRARSRQVLGGGARPAAGQGAAVGRALLGRRHADRGLGQHEELPAEGRRRSTPPAPGRQRRARLPRREAHQRHATPRPPIPEARLFRKGAGKEAKLCFMGHVLMENRNGPDRRRPADPGHRHRRARGGARGMVDDLPGRHRITVGRRQELRHGGLRRRPARAQRHARTSRRTPRRRSAIDGRTTRHPGYAVSQRIRKRIEEGFGWIKTVGVAAARPGTAARRGSAGCSLGGGANSAWCCSCSSSGSS